ncbi:MAG: family 10 glycosylhydrolase [bacterium]
MGYNRNMQRIRRLLVIIVLAGLFISVCTRISHPTKPSPEEILSVAPAKFQKGMWVRAASMVLPTSIPEIIEIAKKYEITDIYAQVIVGGYAYYPSLIVPRSQYLAKKSDQTYDPIDSLIQAAHKYSIRVHAWVNTILAWSLREPPDSTRHLFYTHPEWFIKDITRKSMVDYSADEWYDAGLEGMYLDPSNPMVGDYLKTTCREILEKYPVVGIHLDFIRYPGVWWGLPDNDTTAMFAGLDAFNVRWFNLLKYPQSTFITRWMCWHYWQYAKQKEDHIHNIVRGIYKVTEDDSLHPGRLLTAAIFPNPGLARYRFAQNWMDWDETIDYPVVMSYTDDAVFFSDLLNYTIDQRQDAIFGIGFIWPDMEAAAYLEVKDVIKNNGAGVCFFDFTSLDTMVDFAKFNGEAPAEEYSPILEKEKPKPITDVFYDLPPEEMIENGKKLCLSDEHIDFAEFLLSLSLDCNEDLKRMDLTRDELLAKVHDDIAAFKILDSLVFPIGDTLVEPPEKEVFYEFLPWGDEDTAVVKEQAQNMKELTQQINVYPNVLSDISRAAFFTDDGIKETFSIRRGIYVFKTNQVNNGSKKLTRNKISKELLPLYLSWTIENKVDSILVRY